MSTSIYKYLNIDSTYRNRNLYPNPANFVIPVSFNTQNITNALEAFDPVSLAMPCVTGTVSYATGPSINELETIGFTGAYISNIDNYYINKYLQIESAGQVQTKTINFYAGTTKIATINNNGFDDIKVGDNFKIRTLLPMATGTILQGSLVPTTSLLWNPSSSKYKGQFLYLNTGPYVGSVSKITNVGTGTNMTGLALVLSPGNPPGATGPFEILPYSYDNMSTLWYGGTRSFNNPVCYSIELLYLMVPNQLLKSGYGGTLDKYPYFILKLSNVESQYSDSVIYTNNPYEKSAMFRVPMPLTLRSETFFILKDSKCIEVVKFKPDQSLKFELLLPNGDPIIFNIDDELSPCPPDPLLQISASFAIRRLDKE